MRTFETTIRSRSFWLAVILPPVAYWTIVQVVAARAGDGPMSMVALMALVGLATVLPLAALGWMVCSVAAYTVAPGRIIEHRVISDRQFSLGALVERPRVADGTVVLRAHEWTLRLHVAQPEACLALLDECGARSGPIAAGA